MKTLKEQLEVIKNKNIVINSTKIKIKKSLNRSGLTNQEVKNDHKSPKSNKKKNSTSQARTNAIKKYLNKKSQKLKQKRIKKRSVERIQREKRLEARLKEIKKLLINENKNEKAKEKDKLKDFFKNEYQIYDSDVQSKKIIDEMVQKGMCVKSKKLCKICNGEGGLNDDCYECGGSGFIDIIESKK